MSLMLLMKKTLINKRKELIVIILNTMTIVTFYYLLIDDVEILYPLLLSVFITVVYLFLELLNTKKFLTKLSEAEQSPDFEIKNINSNEVDFFHAMKKVHEDYIAKIYKLQINSNEKYHIISSSIHKMKSSITVIDLVCDELIKNDIGVSRVKDIQFENNFCKNNLDRSLQLLRLNDFSKDYVIEKRNLLEIVSNVINLKKRDFIYYGVFPKVDIDDDIFIYTDYKWLFNLLVDVIDNAIKYSPKQSGNKITCNYEVLNDELNLSIADEGIGINKEDINRVFEPFYTGANGRKNNESTGLGLYFVKEIAEKLGHKISLSSENGTVFSVRFKPYKIERVV